MTVSPSLKKKLLVAFAAAVVAALAWWSWTRFTDSGPASTAKAYTPMPESAACCSCRALPSTTPQQAPSSQR